MVRDPEGNISLDFTGKKSGRGAYICRSLACLKKARKSKRLERSLDCLIPDEVYDALESEMGRRCPDCAAGIMRAANGRQDEKDRDGKCKSRN